MGTLPSFYSDTQEHSAGYEHRQALPDSSEVTILDGGMGRVLLNMGLPCDNKLWSARALIDVAYNSMVVDAHKAFIKAGARMITTSNYAVQPTYYAKAFEGSDEKEQRRLMVEHTKLAAELARKAVEDSGVPSVRVLGCLPPLVDSHRPDLTEAEYAQKGADFFKEAYQSIACALAKHVDVFLVETMGTTAEMLCAVRALAAYHAEENTQPKPIFISMAAGLRNAKLEREPQRAAEIAEIVLSTIKDSDAPIKLLAFNCGEPAVCSQALSSIPDATKARLKAVGVGLGIYPNLNSGAETRQSGAWSQDKLAKGAPIRRREDVQPVLLRSLCKEWARLGATCIGGCCGATPEDIAIIREAFPLDGQQEAKRCKMEE